VNEEEVKIKYVLPWLQRSGVDLTDLRLEQTFSIKLGRQSIAVGSNKSRTHRARLDILVSRGDKNLFIVETKASDERLTDEDRDQAISYARLVHPIAPYAIVTNGHEYQLYDSISKEMIQPADIRILGYEASLPENALLEAQAYFLQLNRANLLLFCNQQVNSELRRVRGDILDGKKYVPSLHVPRETFQKAIATFRASTTPVLLLTGPSGSGKTCELCFLAESLLQAGQPVLFFNGSMLPESLHDAIAAEFAWTFEGADRPIQILKRAERMLGQERLTIIVDAVDEWTSRSRTAELDTIVRALETHQIQLVLGCKSSALPPLLSQRDTPTFVSLLTATTTLTSLTEKEFYSAIEKYRAVYEFHGGFERELLTLARENPFLLRVLFDVAKDSGARHLTFSSEILFRKYYERSLLKIGREGETEAHETLRTVARLLWELNSDSVSEQVVREALGLRPAEPLMSDLFEYSLLLQGPGQIGERYLSFYFQQLRDYLIAFRVLNFNTMPLEQLQKEFDDVTFPSMRGDVFTLYYRLAPRTKQTALDGELRKNAAEYLACYLGLMRKHFPAVNRMLSPCLDKDVGFIAEISLARRGLGMYGFRQLEDGDDVVHFIPVDKMMSESNLARLEGAEHGMHFISSANEFRDGIDVSAEVIKHEVLPRVRQLLDDGRLDESSNPDLSAELVIEWVQNDQKIFGALLDPHRKIRYPLTLKSVLECIDRARLERHFEDEIVKRERRSGKVHEHWSGSTVTYSYSRTAEHAAEIAARVDAAIASNERPNIRAWYSELEKLDKALRPAIEALRSRGEELVEPGLHVGRISARMDGLNVSIEQLERYLHELSLASWTNYRTLVERNFPTLIPMFTGYFKPPKAYFFLLGAPAGSLYDWNLRIYSTPSTSGLPTVKVVEEVIDKQTEDGTVYEIDGVAYRDVSITWTSLGTYLDSDSRFGDMPLRSRVYARVRKDWSAVERGFANVVSGTQRSEGPGAPR
jgi:hypothetical protein